jgi:hypothetical protein
MANRRAPENYRYDDAGRLLDWSNHYVGPDAQRKLEAKENRADTKARKSHMRWKLNSAENGIRASRGEFSEAFAHAAAKARHSLPSESEVEAFKNKLDRMLSRATDAKELLGKVRAEAKAAGIEPKIAITGHRSR